MQLKRRIHILATMVVIPLLALGATSSLAGPYDQTIDEMPFEKCAQCHYPVFQALKKQGGKHRMACRSCHSSYHNFQRNLSWEERVPQCNDCHGQPHGKELSQCLECHQNAHAPVASMPLERLSQSCDQCHGQPAKQMANTATAHGMLGCTGCHADEHGHIPNCTQCHADPHAEFKDNSSCSACHNPHDPAVGEFSSTMPNSGCDGCHSDIVTALKQSPKAHSQLSCGLCHSGSHGSIPNCSQCHKQPHSQEMLAAYDGCSSCHGDVHTLTLD